MPKIQAPCAALFGIALATGLAGCERSPVPERDFQLQYLDDDGTPLANPAAGEWACVLDEDTGLTWEVKDAEPGLHYHGNTYTWFATDEARHRGERGVRDGGECTGSRCDLEGFVETVNERGRCGHRDWRAPTQDELGTLVDSSRDQGDPMIPERAFPHAAAAEYWTGDTYRSYEQGAWAWNFARGMDRVDGKTEAKRIRLVRGQAGLNGEDGQE